MRLNDSSNFHRRLLVRQGCLRRIGDDDLANGAGCIHEAHRWRGFLAMTGGSRMMAQAEKNTQTFNLPAREPLIVSPHPCLKGLLPGQAPGALATGLPGEYPQPSGAILA